MEADMQVRQEEMELKQALRKKTISIIESIINTALGVTKTLALWGIPAGIAPASIIAHGGGFLVHDFGCMESSVELCTDEHVLHAFVKGGHPVGHVQCDGLLRLELPAGEDSISIRFHGRTSGGPRSEWWISPKVSRPGISQQ